jgi:hypothetical protein
VLRWFRACGSWQVLLLGAWQQPRVRCLLWQAPCVDEVGVAAADALPCARWGCLTAACAEAAGARVHVPHMLISSLLLLLPC